MAGQPINRRLRDCPQCAYDLLGVPTASGRVTCPECGTQSAASVRCYFPGPWAFIRHVSAPWPWAVGAFVVLRVSAGTGWLSPWFFTPAILSGFVLMILSTALSWRRAVRLRERTGDPKSPVLQAKHAVFNTLVLTTALWWLICLAVLCAR